MSEARSPDAIERELTRRGFLGGAGAAMLGAAGAMHLVGLVAAAGEAAAQAPPIPGLSPEDSQVRATMAAYADTIVPGPAGGADKHPGALEAGALDELYDPFYGLAVSFPLMHHELQLAAPQVLRRPARFELGLPYRDRERVVLDRITPTGEGNGNAGALAYGAAAVVVYMTYYGTARSEAGPRYIGFPPQSDGYWPRHSYRVRFRGMTRDGNPR